MCFLCDKVCITRKRRKYYCRIIQNKFACLETLKKYATELNDTTLLNKIEKEKKDGDGALTYHTHCHFEYHAKHQVARNRPPNSDWSMKRDAHKEARECLTRYVEVEVLQRMRVLSLTHLKNCFTQFLCDLYALENVDCTAFSTSSVKQHVADQFKKKIKFIELGRKLFVVSSRMDLETITDEEIRSLIFEQEAVEFAVKYRANILKIKKNALPDHLDSEALSKGECDIPRWLVSFWQVVLRGVDNRVDSRVDRLSSCFAQDSIYSVTRGQIKTGKHIVLGIGMKSITGSEKAVNILSRLGYSLSYSSIIELETSAAYSCASTRNLCPSGLYPTSVIPSGVAWDNFDRFVESSGKQTAGKESLHDTVGIMYQSTPTQDQLHMMQRNVDSPRFLNYGIFNVRNEFGRRKRSFEPDQLEDLPAAKQRRLDLSENGMELLQSPQNLVIYKHIQFGWLLSHLLRIEDTPMWVGYHSKILEDNSSIQKIGYLTQINKSPTDPAVVKETLLRSLRIAGECGKTYYNVTFDLAMAKIALRIQSADDQFATLFIHLGPFHLMMSFHKAIGKFISGSGLTDVLIDSEVLARGSLNSFITGKHYNRCRKIHPLLSLALQILHFKKFLQHENRDADDLESIKSFLLKFNNEKSGQPVLHDADAVQLFQKYNSFKTDTLNGIHGKTPQIYLMYVKLVDYYLLLEYSIRTGDLNMYMYVLSKVVSVFFSMNHQNYARYLTAYLDRLKNMETTHPGLREDYGDCFFGVKRTSKSFSRISTDLTLEQTVNADAASRAFGVINLTDSFSARLKWAITHSLRTSITSELMNLCDLRKSDDVANDLKPSAIRNWSKKLDDILLFMQQCTNPFSSNLSENQLYNISTGQSVSDEVYRFLSSIEVEGENQRNCFVVECLSDPERFDRPITKNKIINFSERNTKKVKVNGQVKEIKIQRDVFGRLLHASLQNNLDLQKALRYPLAPISFSFCHYDGNICKTQKSVVTAELRRKQPDAAPIPDADIHIYDGFYLLHTFKNLPSTYERISEYIFKCLTFNKKEVHIVFDRYNKPSIKDYEHRLRGEDEVCYDIRRANKRPAEFNKLLRSSSFKEKFVEFLIDDWTSDRFSLLCTNKTVKLNFDKCYVYEASEGKMRRSIDYDLTCYHEEADTKIVYHICQLNRNFRVTVHCTDSDIPIIMVSNFQFRKGETEIVIDMSSGTKKLHLDINKIHTELGDQFARALAVCHTFTGNDYNPSFYRKGKKKAFSILRRNLKYQETFVSLIQCSPTEVNVTSEIFKSIQQFVCEMYALKSVDVNTGRYELFEKGYKVKSQDERVVKKAIVGYDASCLPPTEEELLQQVKRTMYIASIWCNAYMKTPTEKKPEDCGWTLTNEQYEFHWFDGPMSPTFYDISSNTSG